MPEGTSSITLRPKAGDILAQAGSNLYRAAGAKGMRVSPYLDEELGYDPKKDQLDGFGQVMQAAGIRTSSDYVQGITASDFSEWDDHPQARSLIPEWMGRQWRRATTPTQRAPFGSVDWPALTNPQANPWVSPDYYDPTLRIAPLVPVFPLENLIAATLNIRGDTWRSFYLVDDPLTERYVRVTEFSELPKARIAEGTEHMVRLYKYGRALEQSYENMRRMTIDMLAFYIQRMALNVERDKLAVVLDVLINGDGNSSTNATSHNLTTLDPSTTANNLTFKSWLAYKLKFQNPYTLRMAIMQENVALKLLLLNSGSGNIPLVTAFPQGFGGVTPLSVASGNPSTTGDNVQIAWTTSAPANKIVGFDNRYSVLRLREIGADISETEKFITRQTQIITLSEVEGYAILDFNGCHVLDLTA